MPVSPFQATLLQTKAHRILRQNVSELLKPFNVSMLEWVSLSMVDHDPEIRPSIIATELGVELPMITSLLNSLEEKKLIQRITNTLDKRQRTLLLTKLGKETLLCSEEHINMELKNYFSALPKSSLDGYVEVLNTIIKSKKQH